MVSCPFMLGWKSARSQSGKDTLTPPSPGQFAGDMSRDSSWPWATTGGLGDTARCPNRPCRRRFRSPWSPASRPTAAHRSLTTAGRATTSSSSSGASRSPTSWGGIRGWALHAKTSKHVHFTVCPSQSKGYELTMCAAARVLVLRSCARSAHDADRASSGGEGAAAG